jgi:hypothetical protein
LYWWVFLKPQAHSGATHITEKLPDLAGLRAPPASWHAGPPALGQHGRGCSAIGHRERVLHVRRSRPRRRLDDSFEPIFRLGCAAANEVSHGLGCNSSGQCADFTHHGQSVKLSGKQDGQTAGIGCVWRTRILRSMERMGSAPSECFSGHGSVHCASLIDYCSRP